MSSRYNKVVVEDDLSLPELPENIDDKNEIGWQSKTLNDPFMLEKVKVTEDGLLREKMHVEEVPEEERPYYDEDKENGFESELERFSGSINKVHDGWEDIDYHGMFYFYSKIGDEWYEYEVKYTDGKLEEIQRVNKDSRKN